MNSPARAVGSTTPRTVAHSPSPSASDASRRPPGTSRSTTSAVRVTVGIIKTASAIAAAIPDWCWPRVRMNAAYTKSPATIDGMALMASTIIRSGRAIRPPTSFKKIAVMIASGTEIRVAMATISSDPTMPAEPPPSVAGLSGPVRLRSSVKNCRRSA